jgi:hypothetical protein
MIAASRHDRAPQLITMIAATVETDPLRLVSFFLEPSHHATATHHF